MPKFAVQTSFTDGWRCEMHYICAESVEEACELATQAAGTAEESWISCEPGETIIDNIVELRGEQRIPCRAPHAPMSDASLQYIIAHRDALARALQETIKQARDHIKTETLEVSLYLISGIETSDESDRN